MSITFNRPERDVVLCTNLALQAEHERAVRALSEAQRAQARDGRENDTSVRDAAAEVQRLEDEMRAHELTFTLRGWPRKRWVEFEETHPPRKDNETDKALSIDVSALDEALAGSGNWPQSIVAVKARKARNGEDVPFEPRTEWVDVPFEPRTDWVPLADEMTNAQWEQFATAVLNVNRGVTAAPFSPLASAVTRRSAETSKQPNA